MEVLRENRESLMAVLEAFVYDPLIAWRLTATNQPGGRVNAEQDVDEAVARQRKSKANETEILNGECSRQSSADNCRRRARRGEE
jgi:FKBP12-rapamycin complex-associated protein